jgi:hypothetical protein
VHERWYTVFSIYLRLSEAFFSASIRPKSKFLQVGPLGCGFSSFLRVNQVSIDQTEYGRTCELKCCTHVSGGSILSGSKIHGREVRDFGLDEVQIRMMETFWKGFRVKMVLK